MNETDTFELLNLEAADVPLSAPKQCLLHKVKIGSQPERSFIVYVSEPGIEPMSIQGNLYDIQILEAPDGIYTYVMFTRDGRNALVFTPVRDASELTSSHGFLVNRELAKLGERVGLIQCAGEVLKEGASLTFNFYSGSTGMADLENQGEFVDPFVNKVRELLGVEGVSFTDKPFDMEDKIPPISLEILEKYEKQGVRMIFFEGDDAKRVCESLRNQVKELKMRLPGKVNQAHRTLIARRKKEKQAKESLKAVYTKMVKREEEAIKKLEELRCRLVAEIAVTENDAYAAGIADLIAKLEKEEDQK